MTVTFSKFNGALQAISRRFDALERDYDASKHEQQLGELQDFLIGQAATLMRKFRPEAWQNADGTFETAHEGPSASVAVVLYQDANRHSLEEIEALLDLYYQNRLGK